MFTSTTNTPNDMYEAFVNAHPYWYTQYQNNQAPFDSPFLRILAECAIEFENSNGTFSVERCSYCDRIAIGNTYDEDEYGMVPACEHHIGI